MIHMSRMRAPASRAPRGFTLIELLVALFIAAVMFAMGYGAINQALTTRGSIRRHQQNLVQLETAMRVIEQDFVQLAPRPVRSPDGTTYLACLQGGPTSGSSGTADSPGASDTSAPLVVLTRGGWSNPTGLQRSELERVAYVLDNGTLVREHWNVLDATLSSTPFKRNLLKRLRNVTFRYMVPVTRSWVDTWPTAGVSSAGIEDSAFRMRPEAVEVTLDTQQWGKIVRIFEIAN
ncbi:MAG: type II secretion system minor pseudopilin GspJ [Gammaproteobacteria bacterium]|nr:type II secretion system minor pseudopilin GspJ [Gammaproteobacteria bacterium]MDE2261345.1 type II secretion system minor pseudopilin GspJ [Gammaproteobacteria bacterium]